MKIKTLPHTPSPESFFQPLYQQHEGNLKVTQFPLISSVWLSYFCKLNQICFYWLFCAICLHVLPQHMYIYDKACIYALQGNSFQTLSPSLTSQITFAVYTVALGFCESLIIYWKSTLLSEFTASQPTLWYFLFLAAVKSGSIHNQQERQVTKREQVHPQQKSLTYNTRWPLMSFTAQLEAHNQTPHCLDEKFNHDNMMHL